MLTELGKYIRAALERKGETQAWLAEKLGVSNNAVSKWVKTGKVSRKNYLEMIKILGKDGAPGFEEDIGLNNEELNAIKNLRELPLEARRDFYVQISRMAGLYKATELSNKIKQTQQQAG